MSENRGKGIELATCLSGDCVELRFMNGDVTEFTLSDPATGEVSAEENFAGQAKIRGAIFGDNQLEKGWIRAGEKAFITFDAWGYLVTEIIAEILVNGVVVATVAGEPQS